ncbi:MAG: aspartate carbamoyltransferase [Aquificaceae bacterium]|nr:aspartate carbamoyltransferase [Aquificaceae bacterium]MDW8423957.1 aspartate carbamoyltransferase [Aquificaceae bacterium]
MFRHLISTRDLDLKTLHAIRGLYLDFKEGRKEELKGDVTLLFLESSTRTRLSFEKACRLLGLRTYYVGRGEGSTEKGESFYDTVKTLEALGFDCIIFRVPFVLFPYDRYKEEFVSLINAGDGTHQHPTQGLIDIFTALDAYKTLEGLKVVYVGDIIHSRVFRSGSYLFKLLGARLGVCGPRTLIPSDLSPFGVEHAFDSVDEAIEWADLCIWIRLQEERFQENYITSKESYFMQFGLTKERYEKLNGYFMHPGPVNLYVDLDAEVLYKDKSLVLQQVKNGLYVRMATLYWALSDG